jgi:hypothetical protein
MFDMVKIYGKFGLDSEPTAEDYDFISMHLWGDAEGVYLNKDEVKDTNMNLLITGHV